MTNIFIDTSAFIALYLKGDEFHERAVSFLEKTDKNNIFLTSNYILDEVYTFLRASKGKETAVFFAEFLAQNSQIVILKRIILEDEKKAFDLFKKLDLPHLSFTDCTSFALMKRLEAKKAFSFDEHFAKAGFEMIPG